MQKAGPVVRIAQGLLVVRAAAESIPSIGTQVVDENIDQVGRVVDVFGPTSKPYLAISPGENVHAPALLNATLYVT